LSIEEIEALGESVVKFYKQQAEAMEGKGSSRSLSHEDFLKQYPQLVTKAKK